MRKAAVEFTFLAVALVTFLSGCAQTGQFAAGNMTQVEL
jgi:outer membrane lipoprotein-sorting protein